MILLHVHGDLSRKMASDLAAAKFLQHDILIGLFLQNSGEINQITMSWIATHGMIRYTFFLWRVHSIKLTWQWNIPIFNREYILKRSMFGLFSGANG